MEVSFNPFEASSSGANGGYSRTGVNSTTALNSKSQEDLINEETERRVAAALKQKQEEEADLKRLSRRNKAAAKGNLPNNKRSRTKGLFSKADLVSKAHLAAEKQQKKAEEAAINARAIEAGISKVTLSPKGPPPRSRSLSPSAVSVKSCASRTTAILESDSDPEIEKIRTGRALVTPEEENRILFPPKENSGTPLDKRIRSIVTNNIDPGNPNESMDTSC